MTRSTAGPASTNRVAGAIGHVLPTWPVSPPRRRPRQPSLEQATDDGSSIGNGGPVRRRAGARVVRGGSARYLGVVRVGITILPEYSWPDAQARWRAAEELGFDDAWTFDHLGFGELLDAPWYGALPTLAAAAAVTTRIRLGTLVSTPNFRDPLSFARDLIALDNISNGRFTCGLGSGSTGYDARVLGSRGRVAHRGRRFAEFVRVLDLLLRRDDVTWQGEYYELVGARTVPGCRQQPRLPFVIAANGPQAMDTAARFGEGWVTEGGGGHERLDDWWSAVAALSAQLRAPRLRRILQTDGAPVYALSSVDCFLDFLGRADELGFTDIAVPWPRSSGRWAGRQSIVEDVAAAMRPRQDSAFIPPQSDASAAS